MGKGGGMTARRVHWQLGAVALLAGFLLALTLQSAVAEGEAAGACIACDARHQRLITHTGVSPDVDPATTQTVSCLVTWPRPYNPDHSAAGVPVAAHCASATSPLTKPESP